MVRAKEAGRTTAVISLLAELESLQGEGIIWVETRLKPERTSGHCRKQGIDLLSTIYYWGPLRDTKPLKSSYLKLKFTALGP